MINANGKESKSEGDGPLPRPLPGAGRGASAGIECLGGTKIRVSGHPDYCPEPVRASLQGSVDKEGTLEPGFINCGMRMILLLDEVRPITTSSVLNVRVETPNHVH